MYLANDKSLTKLRSSFKKLKIGLCHGVFDIIHQGHLDHFREAKNKVDILVVSVTSSSFVNKGPRQPLNNDFKRVSFLKSIKYIDYIYLNKRPSSSKIISLLKPNIYFKGLDYIKSDHHGNLKSELKDLKKNKGSIIFTKTKLQSSTKIFNKNYDWSSQQRNFLKDMSKIKYDNFLQIFEKLSNETINIIGEPIIDRYIYCDIVGTTSKDPAISVIQSKNLDIGGGVVAAAKMAANFVKQVNLITYGNLKLIKKLIYPYKNIKIKLISKKNIQHKTRFINSNREEKLLQSTNFRNNNFNDKEYSLFIKEIRKIKKDIIVCDFGVGLFKDQLLKFINKLRIKKFVNVQSNSINLGFNLFTKYKNAEYMCLDTREWMLGLRSEKIDEKNLKKNLRSFKNISITKGKQGSTFISKKNLIYTPVFVKSVKDTTGSGDAYFILTSILKRLSINEKIISFIGNLYAGMHGQNLGNKIIVKKSELLRNVKSIVNI